MIRNLLTHVLSFCSTFRTTFTFLLTRPHAGGEFSQIAGLCIFIRCSFVSSLPAIRPFGHLPLSGTEPLSDCRIAHFLGCSAWR